jgi:hypothetical protein
MRTFNCWDCSGTTIEIDADTPEEAAREYVDGGDWGETDKTFWITMYVEADTGEVETFTIEVEPDVPACTGNSHDWQAPHEIVGGCKSNPGVYGHGGGVTIHEVCTHCGCHKHTDTWAQNPETGEQGLTSVRYESALALAW